MITVRDCDGPAVVRKVITEELSRYADTRIVGAADMVPPEAMTHSMGRLCRCKPRPAGLP